MKRNLLQLLMILLTASSINLANATTTTKLNKKTTHSKKAHKKKSHKKTSNYGASTDYMLGIASYYGEHDGFQGRLMANGKRFNTNDEYTAAHPTLPLGSKLRVTNLANGRTIYVEVRDRMPRENRVIDLSVAAARSLGMHKKGITRVKLVKVTNQEFDQNKRYLEVEDGDSGAPG
jgi:rare lipoprotein A